MAKSIGISDFLNKNFKELDFEGAWAEHIGTPENNFTMLIHGIRKNGKTEYAMRLTKYLTKFGTVYYNSYEQGISKTLKDCLIRNDMHEVKGRVIFGHKHTLEEMKKRIAKRGSSRFIIIDSRDYMKLTADQFKELRDTFPRKVFIIICWSDKQKDAEAISYMADIIVHVKDFVAYATSRFGGNTPMVIWEKKARITQSSLFN